MKQIEMMIEFIAYIFFNGRYFEGEASENTEHTLSGELLLKIKEMLERHDICEAEDLIFSSVDAKNIEHIKAALYFYREVNRLSDKELQSCNFSREEIMEGLTDISAVFGVDISDLRNE